MSLSVEALQEVRDAPKSEASVRPPVDEALVKLRVVAVALVTIADPADKALTTADDAYKFVEVLFVDELFVL